MLTMAAGLWNWGGENIKETKNRVQPKGRVGSQ